MLLNRSRGREKYANPELTAHTQTAAPNIAHVGRPSLRGLSILHNTSCTFAKCAVPLTAAVLLLRSVRFVLDSVYSTHTVLSCAVLYSGTRTFDKLNTLVARTSSASGWTRAPATLAECGLIHTRCSSEGVARTNERQAERTRRERRVRESTHQHTIGAGEPER